MYFSFADLFSRGFFLQLFPGVAFWKSFFLGVRKLLVLINFLIISSLSFIFYLRCNFFWSQFTFFIFGECGAIIRGAFFRDVIFQGVIFLLGNFPGAIFRVAFFWGAILQTSNLTVNFRPAISAQLTLFLQKIERLVLFFEIKKNANTQLIQS